MRRALQSIRRRVPDPIVRVVKRVLMGHREWIRPGVVEEWSRRYDGRLDLRMDMRDEMLRTFVSMFPNRAQAQREYLRSGHFAAETCFRILGEHGMDAASIGSFLEFASGYGRNTRFIVRWVAPTRVVVSDVDRVAVRFNTRTFGTRPLVSHMNPSDLVCSETFDVIFVASLFSHLNRELWSAWLRRLYDMLNPNGVLVFSTHEREHRSFEAPYSREREPGFWFRALNETRGRLDEEQYGTTWVTADWVAKCAKENCGTTVEGVHPKVLWEQDVYVVRRTHA